MAGGGIFDRTYSHGGSGSAGISYGGGCINIFYSVYLQKGNITANGGSTGMVSGVGQVGGAGCVSYGSIASGSYVADP